MLLCCGVSQAGEMPRMGNASGQSSEICPVLCSGDARLRLEGQHATYATGRQARVPMPIGWNADEGANIMAGKDRDGGQLP